MYIHLRISFTSSIRNRSLQPQISTTRSNIHSRHTRRDLPALGHDVPHRERVSGERESDCGGLTGGEEDAVETFEVERGGGSGGG